MKRAESNLEGHSVERSINAENQALKELQEARDLLNEIKDANNEMALTVTAFGYDAAKGALTPLETISTLPPGEGPGPGLSTAETAAHPSGKFVYVSNRGHDTIACFRCDQATYTGAS